MKGKLVNPNVCEHSGHIPLRRLYREMYSFEALGKKPLYGLCRLLLDLREIEFSGKHVYCPTPFDNCSFSELKKS